MFTKLINLMDSFLEMGVPGFDLAVYKDGKCVLRYMGGYSDLENKIPMKGKVTSLNASVSAGIVVYEVVKQRK